MEKGCVIKMCVLLPPRKYPTDLAVKTKLTSPRSLWTFLKGKKWRSEGGKKDAVVLWCFYWITSVFGSICMRALARIRRSSARKRARRGTSRSLRWCGAPWRSEPVCSAFFSFFFFSFLSFCDLSNENWTTKSKIKAPSHKHIFILFNLSIASFPFQVKSKIERALLFFMANKK